MHIKLFIAVISLLSVVNIVHCAELEQTFPTDVTKFIEDRVPCDHFRSEPRDFDVSYKKKFGKQAETEEAERAAFLEKMTKETCFQMDGRLRSLNRKYHSNKLVANKLAEYEYLDVGSGYFHIHKDFPNAKLILEKLVAKGFMPFNVELMKGVDRHGLNWDQPLPAKLTIQIGSMVDVFTAQLAIETLLEYGPKDIGVELMPDNYRGLGLTMLVGSNLVNNYRVYTGSSIQDLLAPGLSIEAFRKFAKLKDFKTTDVECIKPFTECRNRKGPCVSLNFDAATCDGDCQKKVFEKLYEAGILPTTRTSSTLPLSCVGYRKDIDGTESGAKCIAKLLGYEFRAEGYGNPVWDCNVDGYPYSVWVH